jgi:RNA ligase (TIGR02306 family)
MEASTALQEKSTHQCPVFQFDFSKCEIHPNADKLKLYRIPDSDYFYCLNADEWAGFSGLVSWIPPDSLVNTELPQFAFLASDARYYDDSSTNGEFKKGVANYARIKAKKLRGIISFGLLVKAPQGVKDGDNAAQALDVHHYEPAVASASNPAAALFVSGEIAEAPGGVYPKYDIDNFLKYGRQLFIPGEPLYISEKIEGENSCYVFTNGQMNCRSRTVWKKEWSTCPKITLEELIEKTGNEEKSKLIYEKNVLNFKPRKSKWWEALDNTPSLREYCEANPNYSVYGEIFGHVGKYHYNTQGKIKFVAFDILKPDGTWMDADQFLEVSKGYGIPTVPLLAYGESFDFDKVQTYAVGNTTFGANHFREGCVLKPIQDRWDSLVGRVFLKIVNPDYLLAKN